MECKLKNKKILITGGAGFLGSNLARRLLENKENSENSKNNEVSLFIKKGTELSRIKDIIGNRNLRIIEGNLLDKETVKKSVENKDYLFHFAWQNDLKKSMENPIQDLENDLIGLINILEICKEVNPSIKIIFPSTVTVIGIPEKNPSNEDEKEKPLSVYDLHKLIAEKYLQFYYKSFEIKSCVLRLSNVFGEHQKIDNPNRGVLNFMVGRALRNEPLTVYGDGSWIRDYSYVGNFIDAFILAAENENTNGEVYVLGSGEGRNFNGAVEKIKEIVENLTDKQVIIKHIPFPEQEHEINKRNFIADYSKFHSATNWKPKISFDDGLKRMIEFYVDKA